MDIENDNGFSPTQQYTLQGVDCYNFGLSFPRNRLFVSVITNLVARNNSIIERVQISPAVAISVMMTSSLFSYHSSTVITKDIFPGLYTGATGIRGTGWDGLARRRRTIFASHCRGNGIPRSFSSVPVGMGINGSYASDVG